MENIFQNFSVVGIRLSFELSLYKDISFDLYAKLVPGKKKMHRKFLRIKKKNFT